MLLQGGSGGTFPPKFIFKSYFFVLVPSHEDGRDKIIYDTFLDIGKNTEDTFIKVYVPRDDGFEQCRKYFKIDSIPAFVVTTNCEIKNDMIKFPDNGPKDILYVKRGFFIEKISQSPQTLRDFVFNIHLACRDDNRGLSEAKKGVLVEKFKFYLGDIYYEIKESISFSRAI
ncbi:hypothetical protein BGV40_13525 [Methanosarcina sp. Ant1]|nr:hypothetical protein BGV40_13525 [Methanosarcina sp. Ant1]